MARSWGSWSSTSSSGARYRVGIDYTVSGTRVSVSQYVFESAFSIYKDVTLRRTGGLGGTYSVGVNTGGGVVSLGRGGSVTGKRGGSVTIGGRVTNILHGLTCSVSVRVNIPALAPSAPSAPSIGSVTSSSARISWSAPNNNGASIIQYGYRAERRGNFVSGGFTTSWSATLTGLQPNTRYGARVRAENSAGWSSFSSLRYFTTEVARPAPPSNFTATRVNDGRVNLSWSRNATSGAPYDRILIRRQTNSGSWYNLATVSGSATGYTDTSTSYGNSYYYNVRAINAAGQSGYVNPSGGRVYMRPRGPLGNPVAKKQGANIRVSWGASSSDYATGYRIYDSPDGGPWVQVGSTSSLSWTHLDPDPSVTHAYSVSSTRGRLEGNQSLPSNTVQLQAPPLAPTLISPGDGVVLPRTDAVDLVWRHESVDTTDQTEYEVAYRVVATDEVTIYTGTTAESHTIAASDLSGEIRWNARTKGADPSFGPWSPANTFMLASVPSVVIQSPGAVVDTSYVEVTWEYANDDPVDQASWEAQLLIGADDDLVEQSGGNGDTDSFAFETRLEDDEDYRVRVRVRAGSGLWSDWDDVAFVTNFPLPVVLEPELEWDRSVGAVLITLATEPVQPRSYVWTDDSTSEELLGEEVVRTNYVTAPRPTGDEPSGEWSFSPETLDVEVHDSNGPTRLPGFYRITGADEEFAVALADVAVPAEAGSTIYANIAVRSSQDLTASLRIDGVISEPVDLPPGEWTRVRLDYGVEEDMDSVTVELIPYDGTQVRPLPEGSTLDVTQGYVSLGSGSYFDGDSNDRAVPDAVEVERKDAGGEWVLLASGLDPETSITDRVPRLYGDIAYRVVSRTVLPSEAAGPEVTIAWEPRRDDPSVFVNGSESLAMVCTGEGGSMNTQPEIEQVATRFAGQRRPTAIFGVGEELELSWSGSINHATDRVSTRDAWIELLQQFGIVCMRDIIGRKRFGIMTLSFSQQRTIEAIDVSVTQVRYVEGVDRVHDADLVPEED